MSRYYLLSGNLIDELPECADGARMQMGFWFLQSLANTIQYVVNPEFYAFRDLLVLLLNKGQGL